MKSRDFFRWVIKVSHLLVIATMAIGLVPITAISPTAAEAAPAPVAQIEPAVQVAGAPFVESYSGPQAVPAPKVLAAALASGDTITRLDDTTYNTAACLADSSVCTLREALGVANAAGGSWTFNLVRGTYVLSLSGAYDLNNAYDDVKVLGATNVTLVGQAAVGVNPTIIEHSSAAPHNRVLLVDAGATLVISGTRITGGQARNKSESGAANAPEFGGGIYNAGTLTLINSDVFSNTAGSVDDGSADPGGDGGGIYNQGSTAAYPNAVGSLTLINTRVRANHAGEGGSGGGGGGNGGGIYSNGTMTVVDGSLIQNNRAGGGLNGGVGGFGGGIYNAVGGAGKGTVAIADSTLNNNRAGAGGGPSGLVAGGNGGAGGGLYNDAGQVDVTSTTVTNNQGGGGGSASNGQTAGKGGAGGGLYNRDGTLHVSASTIDGNHSGAGGRIDNNATGFGGAGGSGGGIWSSGALSLELTLSTVSNNQAGAGGSRAAATSGVVSGGAGGDGGGIYAKGEVSIISSTIRSNATGNGGGGQNGGDGSNGGSGGGIAISTTVDVSIESSTISGNQTGNGGAAPGGTAGYGGDGGGIGFQGFGSTLTVLNSTVSGNATGTPADEVGPGGHGGGIANGPGGDVDLAYSTVADNTASGFGGGLVDAGATTIHLGSALVALNTAGLAGPDIAGDIESQGYNLIGDATNPAGSFTPQTGDITGVDPLIGPLASNGGPLTGVGLDPMLTQALLSGSPAIDAADFSSFPPTDQRGVTRPQPASSDPDIGAFEAQQIEYSIRKLGPDFIVPGAVATYSVAVGNFGQIPITNPVVSDVVSLFPVATIYDVLYGTLFDGQDPQQVLLDVLAKYSNIATFASGDGCGGQPGGPITCTTPIINPGEVFTWTFGVQINPLIPSGLTVLNRAILTTTAQFGVENILSGREATWLSETLDPIADLSLTKTGPITATAGAGINSGQALVYTIVVSNTGPSVALGTTVLDDLPANVTLNSSSALCAGSVCDLGVVDVGQAVTLTLTATVGAAVADGKVLTNTAVVHSDATDPNSSNNTGSWPTTVMTRANLGVAKVALPASVAPTSPMLWQIVVSNTGPSTAQFVVITDTLDPQLTFISASPGCEGDSATGLVTCTVRTLPDNGEVRDFFISAQTGDVLGTVYNTATVTSATTDTVTANNQARASATVAHQNPTNLVISKSGPSEITAGGQITYVIQVTNTGGLNVYEANLLQILDDLPTGVTRDAISISKTGTGAGVPTCGSTVCQAGTLSKGAVATVIITGTVDSDLPDGTVLTNTASVFTQNNNLNDINNTAMVTTTVRAVASVSVRKVALTNPAAPNAPVLYEIDLFNNGPSAAADVIVTDTLPAAADATFIAASAGAMYDAGNNIVVWGPLSLAAGAREVALLSVQVGEVISGTVLTNTVDVTSPSDSTPLDNSDQVTVTVQIPGLADMAITKTSARTTFPSPTDPHWMLAGGPISYTIDIQNLGPGPAVAVDVKDDLPDGVILDSDKTTVALSGGGLALCAGTVCQLGTMAVNEVATIVFNGRIDPSVIGYDVDPVQGLLTNVAAVFSASLDPDSSNNSASDYNWAYNREDLNVVKTPLFKTVAPNSPMLYDIAVSERADLSDAHDVVLVDTLGSDQTFMAVAPSTGCSYDDVTRQLTCSAGSVAPGTEKHYLVSVQAGNVITGTVLTDTVTITSSTWPAGVFGGLYDIVPPATGNLTADAVVTVTQELGPAADLAITKTASVDPAIAGEPLTYVLTVTNAGPATAYDVKLIDQLPAGFMATSATVTNPDDVGICTLDGACTLGTVYTTTVVTIEFVGTVDPATPGSLSNVAAVSSDQPDSDTNNNVVAISTGVTGAANLSVTKVALTNPAAANAPLLYQIVVSNAGPSDAQNVLVTDTLPANVAFNDTATLPFTYDSGNGTVVWAVPTVPSGESMTFLLSVQVGDVVSGTVLTNTVDVSSPTDTTTVNKHSEVAVHVEVAPAADLQISKSGPAVQDEHWVAAGGTYEWTIVVTNTGPQPAVAVDIKDQLPVGVDLQSARVVRSGEGVGLCAGAVCEVGNMAVGEVVTVTVTAKVSPDLLYGTLLTNEAGVFAASTDLTPLDNTATFTNTVTWESDIVITKTALFNPVAPTADEIYQILVKNNGPSDSHNVVVTDTLGPNQTLESVDLGCTGAVGGSDVTCAIGTLPVGGEKTFFIVAKVGDVPSGTVLSNLAHVTGTGIPGTAETAGWREATATALVQEQFGPSADLQISKTGPTSDGGNNWVAAGGTYDWTLVVTNTGPGTAVAVDVKDDLPAGVELLSSSIVRSGSGNALCGGTVCQVGYMAPNEVVTIILTGMIDPSLNHGTKLVNRATVFSGSPDPTPLDDTALFTNTVTWSSTVYLYKTALVNPVNPTGDEIYEIVVKNVGPSDSHDVVVTDTLGANLTLEGFDPGCTGALGGQDVSCQIPLLVVGEEKKFLIAAKVGDVISGTVVTNTARVSAGTGLENHAEAVATAVVQQQFGPSADLQISKSGPTSDGGNNWVAAGGTYDWTLVVTNTGPGTAVAVDVKDDLPAGMELLSSSIVRSGSGNALCAGPVCQAGYMAPGEVLTITLTGKVDPTLQYGTLLVNQATVFSGSPDPTPLDDTAWFTNTVTWHSEVAITKTALFDPVAPTADEIYQILVKNDGPSDSHNVVVTDTLGPNQTLESVDLGCTGAVGGSDVTCVIGTLPVGGEKTFFIVAKVGDVPSGTVLSNLAHVEGTGIPTGYAEAVATAVVQEQFGPSADLHIIKTGPTSLDGFNWVMAGLAYDWTLVVSNTGPGTAVAMDVKDDLPAGVELQSASIVRSGSGNALCAGAVCQVGYMAPNEVVTITLTGKVDASVPYSTTLVNRATVFSSSPDPTPLDDTAVFTNTSTWESDIIITKTALVNPVNPTGDEIYEIVVKNPGPSDSHNVVVTDTLGANLTLESVDPNCTGAVGGKDVTCQIPLLSVGDEKTFLIAAKVGDVISGTVVTNTARVVSGTGLPWPYAEAVATALVQQNFGPSADLELQKQQLPAPSTGTLTPTVGAVGDLIYQIVVSNHGPATAVGVAVSDNLPDGVTLVDAQTTQGLCGGASCQLGNMAPGAAATITLQCTIDPGLNVYGLAEPLNNVASVSSASLDPDLSNNTDNAVVDFVTAFSLIEVRKKALNNPVGPLSPMLYDIGVKNLGPSDAVGVFVSDPLPPEVTFLGASPRCAYNDVNRTVTCFYGVMASQGGLLSDGALYLPEGQEQHYLISVQTGDVVSGTVITNTAYGFLANPTLGAVDYGKDGNVATVVVQQQFGPSADVGIVKTATTATPGFIEAGEDITYTLTITNNGPQAATNVRVLDYLPNNVTPRSTTVDNPDADDESCSLDGACYLGTVYTRTTAVIVIVARVDADFVGDIVTNTASVSSDLVDPVPSNNISSLGVLVARTADLAVAKTAMPNPVESTGWLVYEVEVTNNGPARARDVVVTDTVGLSQTISSVDPLCTQVDAHTIVCPIGGMARGAQQTLLYSVRIADLQTGEVVTNAVDVAGAVPDDDLSNNHAETSVRVYQNLGPSVDLFITKAATPQTVVAGQDVTYTLTVTNGRNVDATNVQVSDYLPTGLTALANKVTVSNPDYPNANCEADAGTCYLGTLKFGTTAVITIVAKVGVGVTAKTLTNLAFVAADQPEDPTDFDNPHMASATVKVVSSASLTLQKRGYPNPVAPGDDLLYTIQLRNSGPSSAHNVVLTDTVPSNTTLVSVMADSFDCDTSSGSEIVCDLDSLTPGSAQLLLVTVHVGEGPFPAGIITNTAWASSHAANAMTGTEVVVTSGVVTTTVGMTSLDVVKTCPRVIYPGAVATYTIVVTNNGTVNGTMLDIKDQLARSMHFTEATVQRSVPTNGNAMCPAGTPLCQVSNMTPGEVATMTVVVRVDEGLGYSQTVTNTAMVFGSLPDGSQSDGLSECSSRTPPDRFFHVYTPMLFKEYNGPVAVSLPDLVGSFSVEPSSSITSGTSVRITAVVTNVGVAPAGNFWVDFYINPNQTLSRSGLTFDIISLDGVGGAWRVLGLPVGGSVTLSSDDFDPESYPNWTGNLPLGSENLWLYADSYGANGDPNGAVLESNEGNNSFEAAVGPVLTGLKQQPPRLGERKTTPRPNP